MKGSGRVYRLPSRLTWMLDYYGEVNGKRIRLRESSGTENEAAARKLLRSRVEGAHVAEKAGDTVETAVHRRYTVAEALDEYMRDLALREKKSADGEKFRLGPGSPLRASSGIAGRAANARDPRRVRGEAARAGQVGERDDQPGPSRGWDQRCA